MPLAYLSGLDKSPDYDYLRNKLNLNNLCYIGIRDLDSEEINTAAPCVLVIKHMVLTIKEFLFQIYHPFYFIKTF